MISTGETLKNPQSTAPVSAEDRLDTALNTLESYVQQIGEENFALKRELIELRRQYRELETRYTSAAKANETVSNRLDKSIDQLKLLLEEE